MSETSSWFLFGALADHSDHHSDDIDLLGSDGFHCWIGWLEFDVVFAAIEPLECYFAVQHGCDDRSVLASFLATNHDEVSVGDVVVNHGLAMHSQDHVFGLIKERREIDSFVLLNGGDRSTGGDVANERQASIGFRRRSQLNRASFAFRASDEAQAFECGEMLLHGRW